MYRALIVCNSRYPKDPGILPELNGPKADGMLLRDALTDPATGLFDRSEVRLLPEADAPEILDVADEFFGEAEADDVLLFYFSGHGRSLSQELFLCAGNTRTNRLESSAVASSTLSRIITRSFAQVKIVVLDCCHGGGFKGGDLIGGLSGKGRFVIAAASATDQAGDAETRGEPSPFTKALVAGLLAEARDGDGDGAVDLDDLFTHVSGTRFNGHEPQRKFDGAGAVPIARRAPEAVPACLPPAIDPGGRPAPELLPQPTTTVMPPRASAPARDSVDSLEAAAPQAVLDHARVQAFRSELREDVAAAYPPQLTMNEFLARSGLVKEGVPTLSGALLFGENPTAVQPTAMVRCVRFRGTDKTDPTTSAELHGTLPELIVQARDFVAAAARLGELPTTEAAHADALYRFPMIAAREIIANALVHRDYARTDACVAVHVYDDRVEVISPGAWGGGDRPVPDGLQRLGMLESHSQPHNFRLARVLTWAKLVESVGAGLPRSVADCRAVGAPEPVVRLRHGMVAVTLFPLADRTVEPARSPRATVVPPERTERTERSRGIDPRRIARVFCDTTRSFGTGYRISNDTVLTAAHLVTEGARCLLGFPLGSATWEATADVAVLDETTDLAVLRFSPPGEAEVVPPVRFGRVTREAAVLNVETAGFPDFKRRDVGGREYQDLVHLFGTTSSLTNVSSGTLSVQFPAAPQRDKYASSPWGGMAGAPVWSDGVLIGVVNADLSHEGQGTLGAARVDRFLAGAAPDLSGILGIPGLGDLPEVPAPRLRPVSPYLTHVQDIAPQRLVGRDGELAALAEFCHGDQPYALWRGKPWSGKTALMAWFALHPPHDVDVVSFFVTARLTGQSDSGAYTDALADQLSWYLGQEPASSSLYSGAMERLRSQLLDTAARKAQQEGRRLLLVVDGIDEDRGPASGLPSIASLLPGNPPPGLRVLVTGRELPLPDDVPAGHPLRRCVAGFLAPGPLSTQREVTHELLNLLAASEAHRDVLGLIALAEDLPLPELAEVAGLAPYELARLMQGPLGRVLTLSDGGAPTNGLVRFAHPALGEEVKQMLGARLLRAYAGRLEAHSQESWGRPSQDPWIPKSPGQ
ncbi:caspase family protein [Streptomyces sp. R44]|uniref:Caspase family protein n=1 Tax=Streptomyces sp. R44 TaxID=3238633 RepID=A0AB39T9D5_9ACTN